VDFEKEYYMLGNPTPTSTRITICHEENGTSQE
jgi:hypothetical protein